MTLVHGLRISSEWHRTISRAAIERQSGRNTTFVSVSHIKLTLTQLIENRRLRRFSNKRPLDEKFRALPTELAYPGGLSESNHLTSPYVDTHRPKEI